MHLHKLAARIAKNWRATTRVGRGDLIRYCRSCVSAMPIAIAVVYLLARRRPSAITRLIVAVVINAIDRVTRAWLAAQIIKKCLERVTPPIAHRNTSSAVAMPVLMVSILASLNHSGPCLVFASALTNLRLSMPHPRTTPTAFRFTATKIRGLDLRGLAAIAMTYPRAFSAFVLSQMKRNEPTKAPAGEIYRCWHLLNILPRNHMWERTA